MKKLFAILVCTLFSISAFAQYTNTPGVANSVDQVLSQSLYQDGSGNLGIGLYVIDSSGTWPRVPAAGFSDNQIYSQAFYKDSSENGALGVFLIGGGGILPAGTTDNSILTWDDTAGEWVEEEEVTINGPVVVFGDLDSAGRLSLSDGSSNTGKFQTASLSDDRTYLLPDLAGTLTVMAQDNVGTFRATTGLTAGTTAIAGEVRIYDGTSNYGRLNASALSSNRDYYLPDYGGTLIVGGESSQTANLITLGYIQTGGTSTAGVMYINAGTGAANYTTLTSNAAATRAVAFPDAAGTVSTFTVGTALPGTCTQGVWYNDTDSDDCADTGAGDGALCNCTATNTWSLVLNY